MKQLAAEAVCEILTCDHGNFEEVAAKYELGTGVAQGLRLQWERRLAGRCVFCGKPSEKVSCGTCKGAPMDNRRPLTLLKQIKVDKVAHLNGDAVFCTRLCTKCGQPFSVTFGHVVSKTRKFGFFKPYTTCKGCDKPKKGKRKKLSDLNKNKTAEAKTQKTPPTKERRNFNVKKGGLLHRPFANLAEMLAKPKPEVVVEAKPELTPAQKGAITRKKNLQLIDGWVKARLKGEEQPELPATLLPRAEAALAKAQK